MSVTAGQASLPTPAVVVDNPGPVTAAVQAAVEAYVQARDAYRDRPGEDTQAARRAAAAELRYQRWVARGGPGQEPTKATAVLHERHAADTAAQEG